MNHIPVHVVVVTNKHLPEINFVQPAASTNMCQHFSYGSMLNQQEQISFSTKLNIILGLLELFSCKGTMP